MAVITRRSGYAYQNRCTVCGEQWVSDTDDGGDESAEHKHGQA